MEEENRKKILIVDDVARNIQLVANLLKKNGFSLSFAQSGEQALRSLQRTAFDLVLLDVMMPGMDGFEVCRLIKQDPANADLPVIFLTAKTDIKSITEGFNIGGVDYITKPFNSAELLVRVRTQLELKDSKDLLRKQMRELEAAIDTKNRLFSIIAHDLRNPIGGITRISELLYSRYERLDHAKRQSFAQSIMQASQTVEVLLENLLDWSKLEGNLLEAKMEKVDLAPIAEQIMELSRAQAAQKNIEMGIRGSLELELLADPRMLNTILRNLVSNAIKFTPDGGKVVLETQDLGGRASLGVRDTGMGIGPEKVAELLGGSPNESTIGTRNEKGTGLGLFLCKQMLAKHDSRLQLESQPGQGSFFHFELTLLA